MCSIIETALGLGAFLNALLTAAGPFRSDRCGLAPKATDLLLSSSTYLRCCSSLVRNSPALDTAGRTQYCVTQPLLTFFFLCRLLFLPWTRQKRAPIPAVWDFE